MGKIYQLIEKQLKELKEFSAKEKNDYTASKTFSQEYLATKNKDSVNALITIINLNPRKYFGSMEAFSSFLQENRNLLPNNNLSDVPNITYKDHVIKSIIDYETLLNRLEEKIGADKTDELVNEYNNVILTLSSTSEPLKPYTDAIKNELNSLFEDKELVKNYSEDLDFVSSDLIEKKSAGSTEEAIEEISQARDFNAFNSLDVFAAKNNLDAVKFKNMNASPYKLDILPESKEIVDYTKQFGLNKINYTDDLKNKLSLLDNKIKELGVPSKYSTGEESDKYYGLCDYFEKGRQIVRLIDDYKNKTTNQEKIDCVKQISQAKKELVEIKDKYNQLLGFIKETFDLEKVSLPGNIYSGRVHEFNPNYVGAFTPNLPKEWDNENAAAVAILSGYCQFKGSALNIDISTEEYIEQPIKTFLKGAMKNAETIDEKFYLKRSQENTLGKRIAHSLIMVENSHAQIGGYILSARGIEFLNNVEELNENTIDNSVTTNIGTNLSLLFEHSTRKMFMDGRNPSYDSIRNLFAMGDKTDKLYQLSENYYNTDIEKGPVLDYKYVVTTQNGQNTPGAELNRVLKALKDYNIERDNMLRDPASYFGQDEQIEEKVDFTSVVIGAKRYYEDYLLLNKVNIFSLNKNEQKQIMNFLEDPATTLAKKYKKELNLTNEDIRAFKEAYKEENDRINQAKSATFTTKFNEHNNIENGRNTGKTIERIMHDNRGGFLERNFGWSSKEYKALKSAVKAATDVNSPTRGDYTASRICAQKYLDHKLPLGADENALSATEKARVDFCRSIIATCEEMDMQNEQNINNEAFNNNIINNEDFQNQIQKEVNLEPSKDNNIIEASSNVIENDIEINKQ